MESSSVTVTDTGSNTMPDVSSSVMATVAWFGEPAVTPSSGIVPKPSSTLSLSSSTVSCVAVTVKVFDVSPELKTTVPGTPL